MGFDLVLYASKFHVLCSPVTLPPKQAMTLVSLLQYYFNDPPINDLREFYKQA